MPPQRDAVLLDQARVLLLWPAAGDALGLCGLPAFATALEGVVPGAERLEVGVAVRAVPVCGDDVVYLVGGLSADPALVEAPLAGVAVALQDAQPRCAPARRFGAGAPGAGHQSLSLRCRPGHSPVASWMTRAQKPSS